MTYNKHVLESDYKSIQKSLPNMSVGRESDLVWNVIMFVDNEQVEIQVKVANNYPFSPPTLTFKEGVYHPNIEWNRKMPITMEDGNSWSPAMTIEKVLISVHSMLSDGHLVVIIS